MSDGLTHEDCLDHHPESRPCGGDVEYRMPLSGTGKSFARCEIHWDERLDRQEEINNRCPAQAPSDFDPAYAGESW